MTHPFEGRGGGMSQPLGPARRKPTHRELVYDPQHSTRAFKHFMGWTTSRAAVEEAWNMGQASIDGDVPRHWKTNPYPPGRRRDAYDEGIEALIQDEIERRTERRWGA